MSVGQSALQGETNQEKGKYDMFGTMLLLSNVAINLCSMVLSLVLHPFFYEQKRTWFAEHRLSAGVGIALIMAATVINRQIFRVFANHSDNTNTQASLDIAAITTAFIAVTSGVLQADVLREFQQTEALTE